MALLKYSAPIDEMRGSVGGLTYSANSTSKYVKAWRKPSQPTSIPLSDQKAFMSTHGLEWQDLTQAQRDDWDTYAAAAAQALTNSLGQTYYASGYNWYCRINNHLHSCGLSRRDTYPTLTRQAAPTISWVNFDSPIVDDTDVSFGYATDHFLGYYAAVYIAFAPSEAALAPKNRWRLVYCGKGAFTTQERFGLAARDIFGSPPIGWSSFWRIYKQDSQGQRSPATEEKHVIAA